MNEAIKTHEPAATAIPTQHPGRILPVPRLTTLVAVVIICFLIFAFFSGITLRFYASILFSFYALTNIMWISVILLGTFQTLLLVPFRIINLMKGTNIKEFQQKFEDMQHEKEQQFMLKKHIGQGRKIALYYIVSFIVFLISYASIGRLFLIDFYSKPLNPNLLYRFVPYPDYPIEGRFFKIPYVWFTRTVDLGWKWVLISWLVILGIWAAVMVGKSVIKRMKIKTYKPQGEQKNVMTKVTGIFSGRIIILLILSWLLLKHFPVGWELRIFSGDISVPNRTLNTITAIGAFLSLIWVNMPKIKRKVELAREAGISEEVIDRTEKDLFKETVKVAAFVGLGAFLITSQVPSAFELSIFTLEIIALISPLTLDKVILKMSKKEPARGIDS